MGACRAAIHGNRVRRPCHWAPFPHGALSAGQMPDAGSGTAPPLGLGPTNQPSAYRTPLWLERRGRQTSAAEARAIAPIRTMSPALVPRISGALVDTFVEFCRESALSSWHRRSVQHEAPATPLTTSGNEGLH